MLKKFQHDKDIAEVSNFDYGLWSRLNEGNIQRSLIKILKVFIETS